MWHVLHFLMLLRCCRKTLSVLWRKSIGGTLTSLLSWREVSSGRMLAIRKEKFWSIIRLQTGSASWLSTLYFAKWNFMYVCNVLLKKLWVSKALSGLLHNRQHCWVCRIFSNQQAIAKVLNWVKRTQGVNRFSSSCICWHVKDNSTTNPLHSLPLL